MIESAYIHIPFCLSKCFYCSFVSYNKLDLKDAYLKALKKQIKNEYKNDLLKTLYFGGGTPSLLSLDELKLIFDCFNFSKDAEITIEVNPNDADIEYLKGLIQLGFNRLSIGVQSFDDEILKKIGRRHNSLEAKNVIENAINAGFKNISVDFIYGLPNQSKESFLADLKTALEFDISHVSLYGLKIDEGCAFYKNMPTALPDLDLQADMYLLACDYLEKSGFEHYEISNFSKKYKYSRHNTNYWENNSYYGFGCAASGYCDNVRYTNFSSLEEYIENPLKKEISHVQTKQEMLEETIFLGFRKCDGINVFEINKNFGIDFDKKYSEVLDKYSDYLVKTQTGWALTLNGLMISNDILCEFID